jgi:hypothetical protein
VGESRAQAQAQARLVGDSRGGRGGRRAEDDDGRRVEARRVSRGRGTCRGEVEALPPGEEGEGGGESGGGGAVRGWRRESGLCGLCDVCGLWVDRRKRRVRE